MLKYSNLLINCKLLYFLKMEKAMAKYGKKAQADVKRAVHEMKEGTLKSGKSDKTVTSRKQAIAIGLSEAREAGAKVPKAPHKK